MPTSGFRFGPYELLRELGSGGMAETFLAVRRGPGDFEQHVCLKRILPALELDPGFVKQFLGEARIAARLRHKNIAQVVDFGEVAGSHYLALELVDGMDLRALLRRLAKRQRRLDESHVVYVGLELASALTFAHEPSRAVIHRDISPSNVLVSRAGEVYLTDFGIARALGTKQETGSGVVRGKVPYMAPEYAFHRHYDARTDLFGVGVVLYEALAGRRPFDGATEHETLTNIQAGKHPPLRSLTSAPAALVHIVERLIRVAPEERYASAGELHEALASLAPPPTVEHRLGSLVRLLSESLSQSFKLSLPSKTAELSGRSAPVYPEVRPASAFAETGTRDGAGDASSGLWSSTDPERVSAPNPIPRVSWNSTDPSQISQHDRPSPYAEESAPASIPGTRALPVIDASPHTLTGTKKRSALWVAVLLIGLIAFIAAGVGAYAFVRGLRAGVFG